MTPSSASLVARSRPRSLTGVAAQMRCPGARAQASRQAHDHQKSQAQAKSRASTFRALLPPRARSDKGVFHLGVWALAAACLAVTVTAVPAAAESRVPLAIRLVDSATGYAIQAVAAPSPAVPFPGAAPVQLAAEQADGWVRTDAATGVYQLSIASPEYFPFLGSLSVDPIGPRHVRVWLDPVHPPSELSPEQIRSLHRADAMVLLGFVVDDQNGESCP